MNLIKRFFGKEEEPRKTNEKKDKLIMEIITPSYNFEKNCISCKHMTQGKNCCFCGNEKQKDIELKKYVYWNFGCNLHEKGVSESRLKDDWQDAEIVN